MPNGKPGDHPLTDIVVHGMKVFGGPCDELISEISQRGGQSRLEQLELHALDLRFGGHPDLTVLEAKLRQIRAELPPRSRGSRGVGLTRRYRTGVQQPTTPSQPHERPRRPV
jgi:hypothetical protein